MSSDKDIALELLLEIDTSWANRYRIVPIGKEGSTLLLATDAKDIAQLESELQLILGGVVQLEQKTSEWISEKLLKHYRQGGAELSADEDFIEGLIQDAQSMGSSDIHVELLEETGRVRMRIDGQLLERFRIPISQYTAVVNKIKVRAGLDISEKRLPQDGRISLPHLSEALDLRVSTLPVLGGEKVVMRLLGRSAGALSLEELGMSEHQITLYQKALQKPHGVILISGPTGSGKTTTLYATLKEIARPSRNVMTIEDPIEYTLEGISQVQVREQVGLDFPTALRTFLRQDPDVIMVGEIRDGQTAKMAIRASLTGHQVLSTIHTNSAWDTIMRLTDMGVPEYLVASTLVMSVAQRLVRKVCSHCHTEEKIPDTSVFGEKSIEAPRDVAVAKGCPECHYTGYKGRKAIYEMLPIDEELAGAIKQGSLSREEVYASYNVQSLSDQALEMLKRKETTLEETYSYFVL